MNASSPPEHASVAGQWALVVGGSGGVGDAIATRLSTAGFGVTVGYYRNREKAEAKAEALSATGEADCFALDLTAGKQLTESLQPLLASGRRYGALVLSHGANIRMEYVAHLPPEELEEVVASDALGAYRVCHSFLPHFREHGGGNIVAVTSAGLVRYPKRDVLSVAPKALLHSLLVAIAKEEGRHNIRANSVALGVIDAGIFKRLQGGDLGQKWQDAAKRNTPLKRFGSAEEVGNAVAFLAGPQSSYITGQTLMLDGGYSL